MEHLVDLVRDVVLVRVFTGAPDAAGLRTSTRHPDSIPLERLTHSRLSSMMRKGPSKDSVTSRSLSSRKQMTLYFPSSLECERFRLSLIASFSQSPTKFLKGRTSHAVESISTPHLPRHHYKGQ